jgi:hypothetical protein
MLSNETLINPPIIENKALNKLVIEFFYLKAQAVEPLSTFLDYITYEYMIGCFQSLYPPKLTCVGFWVKPGDLANFRII